MSLPRVAIVGRPNVGKSTLLNRLARRRISIVHDRPGVTRDRVAVELEIHERRFELIDTGGIGIVDRQDLHPDIHVQIDAALASAQLVLFVVDARTGPTPVDQEIAQRLRADSTPVLLLANKSESQEAQHGVGEFFELGLGEPLGISAEHGENIAELEDLLVRSLPEAESDLDEDPEIRIAIVGRRNAGKSTFVNAILNEERVIVSELPGTTRDAVDVRFEKDGRSFVAIDTAGIVRRAKLKDSIDFYAQTRSVDAIHRAEVCIFLIDSLHGVSQLDKRIAREISDAHRACVIGVNKWDLVKSRVDTETYAEYLDKALPGLGYAPIVFLTAKTGRNVWDVVGTAQALARQGRHRVGTGELNRIVAEIMSGPMPKPKHGTHPKIFFATQVGVSPPTIVLSVNRPDFFPPQFRRTIENRFRESLPFEEVPLRIVYRKRESLYHD